jgi:2-keto-4-pentenoate hydratase/2-oxohepta-3-ene-1,7-dioic acid hydratase in catechol pathway
MRIIRFFYKKKIYWGAIDNNSIRLFKANPLKNPTLSNRSLPLNAVRFLPPVEPSKVILVGLNYKDHAKELLMRLPKEPLIFLKPPSALVAHGEPILYPRGVNRLDYEAELAIVIKKEGRNIPQKQVEKYIFGYTCLNDVTARDIQKRDVQWTRSKSFDSFCPVGPWVQTRLQFPVRVRSYLNDSLRQDSSTDNFIFSIPYLVSFISRSMSLYPGDIISTGTPVGVGPMSPSDTVEVEVEGVGRLRNPVSRRAW